MPETQNDATVTFAFPEGHPHHGKTITVNGVPFVDGKAEVPKSHAKALSQILVPYYGAAEEGSDEYEAIAAEYAAASKESRKNKAPAAPPAPPAP
jgi:hypothetical protein